jgi:hypothetical protein
MNEIKISRTVLDEMIELKVFESETNILVKLQELMKPLNMKTLESKEMSTKNSVNIAELQDKVFPFIKSIETLLPKIKLIDSIKNNLDRLPNDI